MEYQDGTLIREADTGLTFLIIDSKLSVIENPDIIQVDGVTEIQTDELEQLRQEGGPAISSDAFLAIVDGKGYLVNNGEKRYFTSEGAIRKYHFNRGKFQERAATELPQREGAQLG